MLAIIVLFFLIRRNYPDLFVALDRCGSPYADYPKLFKLFFQFLPHPGRGKILILIYLLQVEPDLFC